MHNRAALQPFAAAIRKGCGIHFRMNSHLVNEVGKTVRSSSPGTLCDEESEVPENRRVNPNVNLHG